MDGTPELTLFMEGAGEQACGFESKRVAPAHSLICHEMSRIKVIFSSPNPLPLMTGERSDLRGMRKGKTGHVTHQMQQSREKSLPLAWEK